MLTLYYLMKEAREGPEPESDKIRYYSTLINNNSMNTKNLSSKCRICLQEGYIPILDYAEVNEALHVFANIQIDSHEDHPKYLCHMCHQFIEEAILFRKIALHTEELMHQTVKQEISTEEYSPVFSESIVNDTEPIEECADKELNNEPVHNPKPKPGRNFKCNVCHKVLRSSYYKHHMTMHDPNHEKFVCDVCGKSFRLRCSWYTHTFQHSTDFPYKCQLCPYRGKYSELLRNHMKTHTGDYHYICAECPARFLFKSNLNRHMLRHKEKQFQCDVCKRKYYTKPMLQVHYDVQHLGIKKHICDICGNAFGYRKGLMAHERHVHKRKKLDVQGRRPIYLQEQNKAQEKKCEDVIET